MYKNWQRYYENKKTTFLEVKITKIATKILQRYAVT